MGLVTGSRWSGSDRSPPGTFFFFFFGAGDHSDHPSQSAAGKITIGERRLMQDRIMQSLSTDDCSTYGSLFFTTDGESLLHTSSPFFPSLSLSFSFPRVQVYGVPLASLFAHAEFLLRRFRDSSRFYVRPAFALHRPVGSISTCFSCR